MSFHSSPCSQVCKLATGFINDEGSKEVESLPGIGPSLCVLSLVRTQLFRKKKRNLPNRHGCDAKPVLCLSLLL